MHRCSSEPAPTCEPLPAASATPMPASTTLRIYAHAFEVRDRQAAEVLGALLPG